MISVHLRRSFLIVGLMLMFTAIYPVEAQSVYPVYTVQPGDSLTSLAVLFHTPVNRLVSVNNISNPDILAPGTQLFIPSLEGYSGEVSLLPLEPGDTLHTLSRKMGMTDTDLQRMNFLTQPESLPIGANVIMVNTTEPDRQRQPITSGMTDLELAAGIGINTWIASEANGLKGTWDLVKNDTLFLPASTGSTSSDVLTGVNDFQFSMLPLRQGKTVVLSAKVAEGVTLGGKLNGQTLEFFKDGEDLATAYGGIARMTQPGVYPMVLTAVQADGQDFSLLQNVKVNRVTSYGVDYPFQVADQLVDPAVTEPELDAVFKLVAPFTSEKLWQGGFRSPSPTPDCIPSRYGSLRSFNGSGYIYFHSGVDFCGSEQTKVFAAAAGVVVFTGEVTVRGNATIIDHGRGVYTGYWHQSKILVNVGDRVTAGQVIGMVGSTGRVTGPHLHFEVFAAGVQVDPTEWLAGEFK